MRRRQFINLITGAAAWPLAAQAQRSAIPVIGYLDPGEKPNPESDAAFRQGLAEQGFFDGRNVTIVFRGSERYDRLPALARELVREHVNVLFASATPNAALAAKAATSTVPIVFGIGGDPVKIGLVASLNRPGGNITGVSFFTSELDAKRLELLREAVPSASTIAFLMNPSNPRSESDTSNIQVLARNLSQNLIVFRATTPDEIDAAFAAMARDRADAVMVNGDSFFARHLSQFAVLAARYRIPAIYNARTVPGDV